MLPEDYFKIMFIQTYQVDFNFDLIKNCINILRFFSTYLQSLPPPSTIKYFKQKVNVIKYL